jgi:hypothetical protein
MYAEYIAIFSSSPEGLQNKLFSLESYCDDWGMKVNIKKTKVIISNKAGRTIKHKFMYKNSELKCVPNYKYLGIYFTASGTFSLAKNELYKKALKAFFKLRKYFPSLNPGIKTSFNVFDHTIKPILLYGSEIWDIFNVNNTKLKETNNIQINDCYKNYKGETLHLKFCKYILGLNKKSVNHASLSELGRHPLHYDIAKSLLQYCYRLENLATQFPLLKDAFLCSKNLHFTHSVSWYSSVNKLLNIFNIEDNSMWYDKSEFGFILRKCLNQKYLSDWKDTSEYHIFIFKDQF